MNAIARRLRNSRKPALIHLCISALVALVAMALIFRVWYPGALAPIQGVNRLVLVLIGVDVVIGPLITAIIYDPAKKWLRLDLAVIAALQTTALLYGLHTIFIGRPVYVVFNVDRFNVVQAQDVDRASLEKAVKQGQPGLPWWGPRTLASRLPTDAKEREALLFSSLSGGADLPQLPHLFVPYADDRAAVRARQRPLRELKQLNGLDDAAWTALLATLGRGESGLAYLPLMGKEREGAVVVDAGTARIIRILALTPGWTKIDPAAPASPRS